VDQTPESSEENWFMNPLELQRTYLGLTTPHVADAIMRLGIPVRQTPGECAPRVA
jgi:hypothetical protein